MSITAPLHSRSTAPGRVAATAPAARPAGLIGTTLLHAKYALIEIARTPMALIGTMVFPALALLFFVVPNTAVGGNREYATQAVISMAVFAIMSGCLFSFALTVAENREKPWDPYLRTLPAPGAARVLAHVFSTGLLSIASLLPVILIGALFTAAEAPFWRVIVGVLAVAVGALPFMFLGTALGHLLPMKAAIAVVQIVMFGFAFLGGLFLPPQMFPDWLEVASRYVPSREAREFVIWAVQGGTLPWWSWVGLAGWIVVTFVAAVLLFRRDEGRRFR
ncbi:ABC transporter permease [Microbacterium gorillae]|uniref:ABC transporter permease n=1 Tax=Microbacterium gorillae TaxID=1231063 RepID=UPI000AEDBFB6|nr:ABC transporter permease [Microbacterium gorillae]